MNHAGGHQTHMWLIGVGAVVALLLGWSIGWALAFAVLACGAMLAAMFWIGRISTQQIRIQPVEREREPHHQ